MLISVPLSLEAATLMDKADIVKNDRVVVNQNTVKDPYYYLGTVTRVSKKDKMVYVFLDNGDKTKATVSNTGKGIVGHVVHKRKRKSVIPPSKVSKHIDRGKWHANKLSISKPSKDSASEETGKSDFELAQVAGPHSEALFDRINKNYSVFPSTGGFTRFGFWRRTVEDDGKFPFPVAMKIKGYDKYAFIKNLKVIQEKMEPEPARGPSIHRWTGQKNGDRTYVDRKNKVTWPEGTITYIRQDVPPSRAFYKYVMGKTNSKLPY